MTPQYEDLKPDPWLTFYDLASRSATFEVYLADVKRDTLRDVAAALEASLSRIDRVVLGIPEVGDEALASIEDGIAAMDEDSEKEIHVEGAIGGIDVTIYLGEDELVITVPADVAAPDTSDRSTPTEEFETLVQFGLELCALTRARALYLLDDTSERDLPDIDWPGRIDPVWERSLKLWPEVVDPDVEEEPAEAIDEANQLFDHYYSIIEPRLVAAGFVAVDASATDDDIEAMFVSSAASSGHGDEYCVIGYTTALDPEMIPMFVATADEEIANYRAANASGHYRATYVVIAAPVVAVEAIEYLRCNPHVATPGSAASVVVAVDLRNEEASSNLGDGSVLLHPSQAQRGLELFGFD